MTEAEIVNWLSRLERRLTILETDVKIVQRWIERVERRNERIAQQFEDRLAKLRRG